MDRTKEINLVKRPNATIHLPSVVARNGGGTNSPRTLSDWDSRPANEDDWDDNTISTKFTNAPDDADEDDDSWEDQEKPSTAPAALNTEWMKKLPYVDDFSAGSVAKPPSVRSTKQPPQVDDVSAGRVSKPPSVRSTKQSPHDDVSAGSIPKPPPRRSTTSIDLRDMPPRRTKAPPSVSKDHEEPSKSVAAEVRSLDSCSGGEKSEKKPAVQPCFKNFRNAIRAQIPDAFDSDSSSSSCDGSLSSDPIFKFGQTNAEVRRQLLDTLHENLQARHPMLFAKGGRIGLNVNKPVDAAVVELLAMPHEPSADILVRSLKIEMELNDEDCNDMADIEPPLQSSIASPSAQEPAQPPTQVPTPPPPPPPVIPQAPVTGQEIEATDINFHDPNLWFVENRNVFLINKDASQQLSRTQQIVQRFRPLIKHYVMDKLTASMCGVTSWNNVKGGPIEDYVYGSVLQLPMDTTEISRTEELIVRCLQLKPETRVKILGRFVDDGVDRINALLSQDPKYPPEDSNDLRPFVLYALMVHGDRAVKNYALTFKKKPEDVLQRLQTVLERACGGDSNHLESIISKQNVHMTFAQDRGEFFEAFEGVKGVDDVLNLLRGAVEDPQKGEQKLVNQFLRYDDAWRFIVPIMIDETQSAFAGMLLGYKGLMGPDSRDKLNRIYRDAIVFLRSTKTKYPARTLIALSLRAEHAPIKSLCTMINDILLASPDNVTGSKEATLFDKVLLASIKSGESLLPFLILCAVLQRPSARPILYAIQHKSPMLAAALEPVVTLLGTDDMLAYADNMARSKKTTTNCDGMARSQDVVRICSEALWSPEQRSPMLAFIIKNDAHTAKVRALRWDRPRAGGDKSTKFQHGYQPSKMREEEDTGYSTFMRAFEGYFVKPIDEVVQEEVVHRARDQMRWSSFFRSLLE